MNDSGSVQPMVVTPPNPRITLTLNQTSGGSSTVETIHITSGPNPPDADTLGRFYLQTGSWNEFLIPPATIGDPTNSTDDHQAVMSCAVRCTTPGPDVPVPKLRWYATGVTVGTTVRPFFANRTTGAIVGSGPSVVCTEGWTDLPFDSTMTVTAADEWFCGVEQVGSGRYVRIRLDALASKPLVAAS